MLRFFEHALGFGEAFANGRQEVSAFTVYLNLPMRAVGENQPSYGVIVTRFEVKLHFIQTRVSVG